MKVLVETDNDEIHEDVNVDDRGRATLGSDYSNAETVSVAVTHVDGEPVTSSETDG